VAKRTASRLALALPLALGGNQNVLDPASGPAHAIVRLWWVMLGGAAVGFGSIVLLLVLGWTRRNRPGLPGGSTSERTETGLVVLLGVVVPLVVLLALFVYADVFVMRSTAAPRPGSTALTIDVVGHQWFWEVRYPGTVAVTANEIHIPVGTRVNLVGTTADVIHSVWLPELNRKVDLIPGRENRILLEADRVGRPQRSARGSRTRCGPRTRPRRRRPGAGRRRSSPRPARAATRFAAPRRKARPVPT
jgi:cytochrome c oxidase subunit 2